MNTYAEIANDLNLWNEYFNTDGAMTDDEFYAMSVDEKVNLLIAAFG